MTITSHRKGKDNTKKIHPGVQGQGCLGGSERIVNYGRVGKKARNLSGDDFKMEERVAGLPEIGVRLGNGVIPAAFMPMPEAPVHEYAGPVFAQNQVRMSRQAVMMQSVPKAVRMQILPDYHFRLRTFAAYVLHALVSLGRGQMVRH